MFFTSIRNSKLLRWPLLALVRVLMRPLRSRVPLIRRAVYDAKPLDYLVTGDRELFVVSTRDEVIGRELFLHGQFDFSKFETALEILSREGRPSPVHLIDVGANIGTIIIPALVRNLVKSATAIEPHALNLRLLRANLALNEVAHRAVVWPVAVGDKADTELLLDESSVNSGNHKIGESGVAVHATRLDDLHLPVEASILWMDIEGYEGHALKGAPCFLESGAPIVLEFNPQYLRESGGLEFVKECLVDRRLFDLGSKNGASCTFSDLMALKPGIFTDVLVI